MDPVLGRGFLLDAVLALPLHRCAGPAEVESLAEIFARLVECVVDLLSVDLADDVEGRVARHVRYPFSWRQVARAAKGSGL